MLTILIQVIHPKWGNILTGDDLNWNKYYCFVVNPQVLYHRTISLDLLFTYLFI